MLQKNKTNKNPGKSLDQIMRVKCKVSNAKMEIFALDLLQYSLLSLQDRNKPVKVDWMVTITNMTKMYLLIQVLKRSNLLLKSQILCYKK